MEGALVQRLCSKNIRSLLNLTRNIPSLHCCSRIRVERTLFTRNTTLLTRTLLQSQRIEIRGAASQKKGKNNLAWAGALALTGVCGIVFYVIDSLEQKKKVATIKSHVGSTGRVDIGGKPWTLVDHNGVERTEKDFSGQWVLMYFGFTHCPDVCPEELEKMVQVVDSFNERKDVPNIQPLFITIDPARDTKEVIKKYCQEFSPTLLGLTGTEEQLEDIRKGFRIFFSTGPVDENGDYLIDHTIICYLTRPDGSFADYYPKRVDRKEMIKLIEIQMKRYEKSLENKKA
ncbi:protein SCO1 homolog, mitochondrial-like [Ylistrum balloti]|uniref:protein SCO1 homolog, mitochondrial-like n=1 Tax=Ylistrum balloti TaxID=509963 RepID=UPI002905DDF1|nr:protein SCO1 homolog, mitochondrial-like [Ylistrum balloti]